MGSAKRAHIVAGIDVGTTKICTLVGHFQQNRALKILGHGVVESAGLRKGVVVNLSDAVRSIRRSVEEAEARAQVPVQSAFVGIGGAHMQGQNGSGAVEVHGRNNEITSEDIRQCIDDARGQEGDGDRELVHVLPQEFVVDGQAGIDNPLGMVGRRLQANIHTVWGSAAVTQNLVNAVNKAGVIVQKTVMQQLASADAILSADEKDLGVVVLDIGGGTTDLAYFRDGAIWHSQVFPVGGNHFTRDIAVGLRTPLNEAERLKRTFGCAVTTMIPKEEMIEVPGVGGRPARTIARTLLCEIIQARAEEILNLVAHSIRHCVQGRELVGGVVLSGGGALLEGIEILAEQSLRLPVRVGCPLGADGAESQLRNPIYATAVGLLLFGGQQNSQQTSADQAAAVPSGVVSRTSSRMRNWFYQLLT